MLQPPGHRSSFRPDSRGPHNEISLAPVRQGFGGRCSLPPPFRAGPTPLPLFTMKADVYLQYSLCTYGS